MTSLMSSPASGLALSSCLVIVLIGGTFHSVHLPPMIRSPRPQSVPPVTPEQ
jgi:hypothetical protein